MNTRESRLIAAARELSRVHKNARSSMGFADYNCSATRAVDELIAEYERVEKARPAESSPYQLGHRS